MMENELCEAKKISEAEIETFKKILFDAGEVTEETFYKLIAKNPLLLFLDNRKSPTGVGALKIPFDSHKAKVFRMAGSKKNTDEYIYELGWIVSLTNGNGNRITEILAASPQRIFATVREKNEKMIHLLKKYGLRQDGVAFPSNRGDYQLLLFTK